MSNPPTMLIRGLLTLLPVVGQSANCAPVLGRSPLHVIYSGRQQHRGPSRRPSSPRVGRRPAGMIADHLGGCLKVQDRGVGQVGPADDWQEPPQCVVEPVLPPRLWWSQLCLTVPAAAGVGGLPGQGEVAGLRVVDLVDAFIDVVDLKV